MGYWTEDRDATLIKLWEEGHSAGAIADGNGWTRNMVIGRVTRLRQRGIVKRDSYPKVHRSGGHWALSKTTHEHRGERPKRPRGPRPLPKALTRLLAPVEPPKVILRAGEIEPNGSPVSLMQLSSAGCKWPVTKATPHMFCNKLRRGDGPYCDEHHIRSYSPRTDEKPLVSRRGAGA